MTNRVKRTETVYYSPSFNELFVWDGNYLQNGRTILFKTQQCINVAVKFGRLVNIGLL
jgi:hypothetical protein